MNKDDFNFHCSLIHGFRYISPAETLAACAQGAMLVDIREEYHYCFKSFDVSVLAFIPLSEMNDRVNELPKDKFLILADSGGVKCVEAANILKAAGLESFAILSGGIIEWERLGMPVITDKSGQMTGSCMCQLKPREKSK